MCDMDPSGTYDFLLVLHNIFAPNSYTVSETNKDFGRQTQIFFALRVFYRPVENFTVQEKLSDGHTPLVELTALPNSSS